MTKSPTNRGAVVITGASRGIGRTLALDLNANGFDVFAGVRKEADGEALKERSDGHITPVHLEVTDDDSIRGAADQIAKATDGAGITGIVNNAAVFSMGPVEQCPLSDIEYDFGVNVFGAIAVIQHFMPQLRARSGRIVNVSSSAHTRGAIDFDGLHGERKYSGIAAYGQSKLANVLFTNELARRLDGTGVTANSLHPGVIRTGFGRNNSGIWGALFRVFHVVARPFLLTPEQGAQTSIYLASSPDVEGVTGEYFAKSKQTQSSDRSHDTGLAQRLWQVSEELTK